ncbi:hypothetical protein FPQ18DRAFT_29863 [Pyronema domesticum]|nr:hypothetical protein FPQ18DRAFT_29863 [Pyronema domesticum]
MPPSLPLHLCRTLLLPALLSSRLLSSQLGPSPQGVWMPNLNYSKRSLFHVPFTSSLSYGSIIAFSVEYHWSLSSIHRYLYIHHTNLNYFNLKCSLRRCGILQVMW